MKSHKTIKGYSIEIETNIDDDPSTQGWVEKGGYSASLAALEMHGGLTDGDKEKSVSGSAIDAIVEFAESVGY